MAEGHSIGVDIGGTFTDCAVLTPGGERFTGKVATTPGELSVGFFNSIEAAAATMGMALPELLAGAARLTHGTTVGINALVVRRGARVGLLATRGHGDALRIMDNSGRATGATLDELLDYSRSSAPRQFVEPDQVREVTERLGSGGEPIVELDEPGLERSLRELLAAGAEAIAICFLWGHVNPVHERRAREIALAIDPDLFVTCGHEVAPRTGEYPRTATTVMNAYVGPLMRRYVDQLVTRAAELGFRHEMLFATCQGGLADLELIRRLPLLTAQSGPVAGSLGCSMVAHRMGFPNVIQTDMGGTSLDASLIEGADVRLTDEAVIERHQVFLRKVDVDSIGTGGGSIAWYDEGKRTLRVGPQSAGAVPGPVCYGRGGSEPTVTDADLVLGLLSPERPLAGDLRLDLEAAEQALGRLGERVGLDPVRCAAGIVRIADSQIEDLLRRVTLQQGRDPRDFAVWALGGAAGLHCGLYSAGLGVEKVVLPMAELVSVWSAFSIASAPVTRTFQRPLHATTPFDAAALIAVFAELEAEALAYAAELGAEAAPQLRHSAQMKHVMQYYSVDVELGEEPVDAGTVAGLVERFEQIYEQRYGQGSGYPQGGVAITNVRTALSIPAAHDPLPAPRELSPGTPLPRTRRVFWAELDEAAETDVYAGEELRPGDRIGGPAVIEYEQTTVAVRPGRTLEVDRYGNLVLSVASREPAPQRAVGAP